jgi:hypothetical protein
VPPEGAPLRHESCLFEATGGFRADFEYRRRGRVVFRVLASEAPQPGNYSFEASYLSIERNVLHTQREKAQVSNAQDTNLTAIAAQHFMLAKATTVSLPMMDVPGASSVTVKFFSQSADSLFVRRDTMRVEQREGENQSPPFSVLLAVSASMRPRYIALASPGRHVFSSRSCLGVKGIILTMDVLDRAGKKMGQDVGLASRLSSSSSSAVAIPRARRLERPERFNKEIIFPEDVGHVSGMIMSIADDWECYYDIMSLKFSKFRHSVGVPVGVSLFEEMSLKIHQEASARSREEFLSLMSTE